MASGPVREALSAIVAREWILQEGLGRAGVVVDEVRLGAVGLVDIVVGCWVLTLITEVLSLPLVLGAVVCTGRFRAVA